MPRSERFVGADGWPCDFAENTIGARLIAAMRALHCGDTLDDDMAEVLARQLYAVANLGRDEELPRNRPASQKASEAELEKLVSLAERLTDHIEAMHRPAVAALVAEGADPLRLAADLQRLRHDPLASLSGIDVNAPAARRPPKIEAREVAIHAARLFECITGRPPTYTTDPATSERRGAWPGFLGEVFAALAINASVNEQARAASVKSPAKQAD